MTNPVHTLLNRLPLWQKFSLLGLLGVALAAVPLALFIAEVDKSVDAADAKVRGMVPARAVLEVVVKMQEHRGLSAMALAGDGEAQKRRAAKQGEVERVIEAADPLVRGIDSAALAKQWQSVRAGWAPLPGKVAEGGIAGGESFAEHTALIDRLLEINDLIGDAFGLRLYTRIGSYQLADAALGNSPALMEMLGRMRGRGAGLLVAGQAAVEERAAIASLVAGAQNYYDAIERAAEKAAAVHPALGDTLIPALKDSLAPGREALELTAEQIVRSQRLNYSGAEYFDRVTAAIGLQRRFHETALDVLEEMLRVRQGELRGDKYLLLGTVLALCLAAAALGTLISRSITVPLGEAVSLAREVAAGDLSGRIEIGYGGEVGGLLRALMDMSDSLTGIVSEVRDTADTIVSASGQIATDNEDLSSRTTEQASSLEETAASMAQLTSTVKQNADNAHRADQQSQAASGTALKGSELIAQVIGTMEGISESSQKIVDIIGVIDGIAFQTNILALNASVEAARVGEHGRGFSVVAAEVRALAQQAAAAAGEIKRRIHSAVEQIESGVRLAGEAGTAMDEIVAGARLVSDAIGEISTASEEQSAGIEQVNGAIAQMDQATQRNASLVEEATAVSKALRAQAHNLARSVHVFRLAERLPEAQENAPTVDSSAGWVKERSEVPITPGIGTLRFAQPTAVGSSRTELLEERRA